MIFRLIKGRIFPVKYLLDFDNLRMIVVVRGQVKPEFKNINKKSTDYLAKLTPLPPLPPPPRP